MFAHSLRHVLFTFRIYAPQVEELVRLGVRNFIICQEPGWFGLGSLGFRVLGLGLSIWGIGFW